MLIWPLFGTTNQLMAGLTLAIVVVILTQLRRPTWPVLIPLVFVTAMSLWAAVLQLKTLFSAGNWLLFQTMQQGSPEIADVPADHPFHKPGTFDPPEYFMDPGYPKMHFIEHQYAHDWTNWWVPNRAGVEAMLRASGFSIEDGPADEVYLCRTAPVPFATYGPAVVYPARPEESAR